MNKVHILNSPSMLQTPIKLGSQLSHNRNEWDDIIDYSDIPIFSNTFSVTDLKSATGIFDIV